MFEIEIKAHVFNREEVIKNLNNFAEFSNHVQRHDVYWRLKTGEKTISARIRKEETDSSTKFLLTYKKKELKKGLNGQESEVNDEKECEISNTKAIETLLGDIGFIPADKKDKNVYDWKYKTDHGEATIELCTVLPLGDFLEIEILANSDNAEETEIIQQELYSILEKAGIDKSAIEPRYYTDMLREYKA